MQPNHRFPMKPFHPSAALVILCATAVIAQPTNPTSRSSGCSTYNRVPRSTYGMDDGGCYFCAIGTTEPLSGNALSENCKRMCEADDSCISYTIARPVVLPAHEYYWGEKANCCLERREYPPGAFVNPNPNKGGQVFNNCQRDAMCWTRYEKDKDKGKGSTKEPCFDTPKTPSELCTAVFGAVTYTQDKIDKRLISSRTDASITTQPTNRCWQRLQLNAKRRYMRRARLCILSAIRVRYTYMLVLIYPGMRVALRNDKGDLMLCTRLTDGLP